MLRITFALAAALAASAAPAATLVGFASLPAATFIAGPTSGQFQNPANGVTPPYVGLQPVQGFSSVIAGPDGTYRALSDNGFGSKPNSADALLLVHDLKVDFRTADGGTGAVEVVRSHAISDPNRLLGFPIVADMDFYPSGAADIAVDPDIKSRRLLTGWDLDPESIRPDGQGGYWIGEEFGPFMVRTNADFEIVAVEVPTPGVKAPQNPYLGGAAPTLGGSRGYEGMGVSADGRTLYPMLEGTVAGDPAGSLRIEAFDALAGEFLGERWLYQLSPGGTAIGEMSPLSGNQFVVIERDGSQGANAQYKKLFLIDLDDLDDLDDNGFLRKTLLADLLALADPFDLDGDGSDLFRFPFQTIESVMLIDPFTLLLANDNNYPGSAGRIPGVPEDNEFILIRFDDPLVAVAPVPLPAAGWMLLAAIGGLTALRRRG